MDTDPIQYIRGFGGILVGVFVEEEGGEMIAVFWAAFPFFGNCGEDIRFTGGEKSLWCETGEMLNAFRRLFRRPVSLADQLRVLAECGIALNPGVSVENLLEHSKQKEFESKPYITLLCAMGSVVESPAETRDCEYASDSIWHFDSECIEDHGDYVSIVSRMSALANGDLPLTDLQDWVDIEGGEAWVSFTLDGGHYRWVMEVENDWVDPSIFSRLGDLLCLRSEYRRFTYIDLGGQDCLIGYATDEQRRGLQVATGIKVQWLHDAPLS